MAKGSWINNAEKHYKAKYIGFYDIPTRDNVHVFYQANPNRELGHSEYFGLIFVPIDPYDSAGDSEVWICNAKSILEANYHAIYLDGKYYVSRFRHDYVEAGPGFLDGGISYIRYNPAFPPTHLMHIVGDHEEFTKIEAVDKSI